MDNKNLKTIQVISKIGWIISRIVKICCIVGAICCLVGIISLTVTGLLPLKIGGVTIHGLIEVNSGMTMGTIISYVAAGMILCIGEIIISTYAVKFFKKELEIGTPFDYEVADEMKQFGIRAVVIPIVTLVIAGIVYGILTLTLGGSGDMHMDAYGSSIGLGIGFILMSVLCRYGADMKQETAGSIKEAEPAAKEEKTEE